MNAKRMDQSLNVATILFPDERAAVAILEILRPYSLEERRLILQVVEENKRYPHGGRHSVQMPGPLASHGRRLERLSPAVDSESE